MSADTGGCAGAAAPAAAALPLTGALGAGGGIKLLALLLQLSMLLAGAREEDKDEGLGGLTRGVLAVLGVLLELSVAFLCERREGGQWSDRHQHKIIMVLRRHQTKHAIGSLAWATCLQQAKNVGDCAGAGLTAWIPIDVKMRQRGVFEPDRLQWQRSK